MDALTKVHLINILEQIRIFLQIQELQRFTSEVI